MTHPIMVAAAKRLTIAEERRIAERENTFRTWGPRSVTAASQFARQILGDEAATLEWKVLGLLPFEGHLQAIASLDTVGGQHLELYYSGEGETERLMLRASCVTCPNQIVQDVTSMEQLGQLLSQTPAWQFINPRRNGGDL